MGKLNLEVNELLRRKDIFADLMNGSLYHGRQTVRPEELEPLPEQNGVLASFPGSRLRAVERTGDIRMRARHTAYSVIYANESQAGVHYAMPIRDMLYCSLEYTRQLRELEKAHREAGDLTGSDEFLSGISGRDRLQPVVCTVLYLGDHWDGCMTLHDLLDIDWTDETAQILRDYIPDYHINLIPVRDIEHPEYFRTCLQEIFTMVRYRKDKNELRSYVEKHRDTFRRMDSVEMSAALAMLGASKRMVELLEQQNEREGSGYDLCEAIQEMIHDGIEEGKEQGIAIGEERGIAIGEERGIAIGIEEGKQQGIAIGEERGIAIGEERLRVLCEHLMTAKRLDDLAKAMADQAFRQELYHEFGIA